MNDKPKCALCGEPMPAGEEMFKHHGYSGNCPKPPLPPKPQLLASTDAVGWLRSLKNSTDNEQYYEIAQQAIDALEALAGEVENLRHDVARHMGIANAAEAERDELANWKASFLHENEQILASNAQLAAERDRLKAALEDIGKQPLITEMGDDDLDGAIEEGYDQCILTARKALGDAS